MARVLCSMIVRPGRLTNSAARTNVALFIHRAVRPLTPPGPRLRALGASRVSAARVWEGENWDRARLGAPRNDG